MKKLVLFLLCIITILSTGSVFAALRLPDVENTKYEEPVNMLITLGLVKGYEDNTYRPDNVVNRAEMAKLMVIALGKEGDVAAANNKESMFKDVHQGSWEYGYVNVAADNGIINGYPDGTFGPENDVTYAEATAMLVRALGFEEEVSKSDEVWPANYINEAKKLSLYTSIGTVTANEGAKRGNIAILLWNTLRTGTCEVVGENSNGVIYGSKGEKLINKSLTKFTYLEDATASSVKFPEDDFTTATVKFSGDKTISVSMEGEKAASLYGLKYDVLYNNSSKKIERIEESTDNDTKKGEIESLTSSKIYIKGGNSKGYSLPDDKYILLYGVEELSEAVEAQLVFSGSTVKYMTAYAPDKVTLALVLDSDVTVSKKDGLEIINYKASSSKKYALAEDEKMPDEKDIILYYLNGDNEVVILRKASITDAKEITSAASKKITLGSKAYRYDSTSEYVVAQVSKDTLKAMNVTSIEDEEDAAIYLSFGNLDYFIVYVGGTESIEKEIANELKTAKSSLNTYIKKAEEIDEKLYTQATYSAMANSLATAKTTYNSSSTTVSKVNTAYEDLKTKYNALKKISSLTTTAKRDAETEIVTAKARLRALVNGSTVTNAVKNKSTYTTASYKTFNTALSSANTVLAKTNATLSAIESAEDKLNDGIAGLTKNSNDADRKAAIEALTAAKNAAAKVGKASEYTKESYDNFKAIYDEVSKINTTTATIDEINSGATRLNNAIKLLAKNSDVALDDLNATLLEAVDLANNGDLYTTASLATLNTAIDAAKKVRDNASSTNSDITNATTTLQNAIDGLVKIDETLASLKKKANSRVSEIAEALALPETTKKEKEDKITALTNAIDQEEKALKTAQTKLEKTIAEAKALTETDWNTLGYTGSFATMQEKLTAAEATLKVTNVTSDEVVAAFQALNAAMK